MELMALLEMKKTEPPKEETKTGDGREAAGSPPESHARAQPSVRARSQLSGGDFSADTRSADFSEYLFLGRPEAGVNLTRTRSDSRSSRLSNQVDTDEAARGADAASAGRMEERLLYPLRSVLSGRLI